MNKVGIIPFSPLASGKVFSDFSEKYEASEF